jgi:hypothetical protein
MDPNTSGRHTERAASGPPTTSTTARSVMTLNQTVPTYCTSAAHQSIDWVRNQCHRRAPPTLRGNSVGVVADSTNVSAVSAVKPMDPGEVGDGDDE